MIFFPLVIAIYILLIIFIYIYKIKSTYIALAFLLSTGIFIIISWNTKNSNNYDACLLKFGKNNKSTKGGLLFGGCIEYWHVLHMLLYVIIGLLMPNYYLFILIVSILWELFEHVSFKYILRHCNSMFCGRVEDIFLNMIGYIIGSYLASLYYFI
jgi:hypothetical protein